MSFFKKVLGSIGIGGTKVDTVLEKSSFRQGETVRGTVIITGGDAEQHVESIDLHLMGTYTYESNDHEHSGHHTFFRHVIHLNKTYEKGVREEVSFEFELPFNVPISLHKTKLFIKTGLDIQSAVDPTVEDHISILPSDVLRIGLEAIESMGFNLVEVECEKKHGSIVQEFEYRAHGGAYRGKLDELECVFRISENGDHVDMYLQIDTKARNLSSLFSEALGTDEKFVTISYTKHEMVSEVAERIKNQISRFV
jgi:sporulation-control protein